MAIIYTPVMTAIAKARGQPLYKVADLEKWILTGILKQTMLGFRLGGKNLTKHDNEKGYYTMSDVEQAYKEAAEVISESKKAYDNVLQSFRSAIKNDLASIGASADRVQKEAAKQMQAYRGVIDLMSSENMLLAIQNAERLASALKAISELEQHRITFSVMEKG
jgi:aspartyl/asparaginyl-tRNA synthetase